MRNFGLPGRTESHCRISNRAKKHISEKEKLGNKLIVTVITTSLSGVRKRHLFYATIIHKNHSLIKNVLKYKITKSDVQISPAQLKKASP